MYTVRLTNCSRCYLAQHGFCVHFLSATLSFARLLPSLSDTASWAGVPHPAVCAQLDPGVGISARAPWQKTAAEICSGPTEPKEKRLKVLICGQQGLWHVASFDGACAIAKHLMTAWKARVATDKLSLPLVSRDSNTHLAITGHFISFLSGPKISA